VSDPREWIYLTFDDGPDPAWTPRVLEALERAGAHASFFVLASRALRHPGLVRAIAGQGHRVELHGMEHPRDAGAAADGVEADVRAGARALAALGFPPARWRPAFGCWPAAAERAAQATGLKPTGWSADPRDWQGEGVDRMLAVLDRELRPGSVVVMHDAIGPAATRNGCAGTVDLIEPLAEMIRARGAEPAPLPLPGTPDDAAVWAPLCEVPTAAPAAPLVFIHHAKAAGTTIRKLIVREYGAERVRWLDGFRIPEEVEGLRRTPGAELARIRVIGGHMPFGLAAELPGRFAYMTMLRDPVARIVSHYRWALRTPVSRLHRQVVDERLSLREYVERSDYAPLFNNAQTRLLGAECVGEQPPASPATLERAKRNLERIALIGITERFEESLRMFRARLGWSGGGHPVDNAAPGRPVEPTDAEREAIESRNALDRELYVHAEALLESRLAEIPREHAAG
jgi:peptidoglycan/xylan/chitin deacetylase (PgdA/CDA1 family)